MMKKFNFTVLAGICASAFILQTYTFANEIIGDSNPFIEEQVNNPQLEPKDLVVYSFAKNPSKLSQSNEYLTRARATREYGFTRVHSSQIRVFDNVIRRYKDGDQEFQRSFKRQILAGQSKADLEKFSMLFAGDTVNLDIALTSKFDLLHSSVGGNFIPDKGWDQLTRIVKSKELGNVIIEIMAFTGDNGLLMDKDAVNFDVNGNPGILIVMEDETGRAETSLTWADNEKAYTIQLDRNVNANGVMASFKNLTQIISGS
ncbi:hypothetical protein [Thalassomonas sp. RHCl1]|uniref:hypothetical protein n=1 Tax=Thalassomonas sp. RHCl1 TaxID=2995320 RepID=UPI00248CC5DA|nr:hypothetical protein [Thalassomonas sp. RHCl1]